MATFKTPRQEAATGSLTEHHLRVLIAKGMCPGIYIGNRFLINSEALAEMLEKQSREAVKRIDG